MISPQQHRDAINAYSFYTGRPPTIAEIRAFGNDPNPVQTIASSDEAKRYDQIKIARAQKAKLDADELAAQRTKNLENQAIAAKQAAAARQAKLDKARADTLYYQQLKEAEDKKTAAATAASQARLLALAKAKAEADAEKQAQEQARRAPAEEQTVDSYTEDTQSAQEETPASPTPSAPPALSPAPDQTRCSPTSSACAASTFRAGWRPTA